jgi:hypothetical protein
MYQHPPGAPTFGAYQQPPGYGQPAAGAWNPQPTHRDDRHGNKAHKDPLVAVVRCPRFAAIASAG